jgi:hypothetical protein
LKDFVIATAYFDSKNIMDRSLSDGIEIHFDEKRGRLELACEPDAFAPYREIARKQLVEASIIDLDKVNEINLIDTAAFVARRNTSQHILNWAVAGVVLLVIVLAVIGFISVIHRIFA